MIRGLLLCGGSASRFGSNKLLARTPRGDVALSAHAAAHLMEGAGNALAVIPPGAAELRSLLHALGCEILESADTRRGLGASLAAGVAGSKDAGGWIVALGDMPYIQAATIAAVRAKLEDGALIAAPVLAATGARGHPVGFARALREELLALDGDIGARDLIQRHREAVVLIPVDDPGIVVDIDTPQDLAT